MDGQEISRLRVSFEDCAHSENGVEFWLARDLQGLLEYAQWRSFEQVIERAKHAGEGSNLEVSDHFADISKTIPLGSGASAVRFDFASSCDLVGY